MIPKVDVYLGLGSNEGEREVQLMRAMTLLDQAFGGTPERISKIIETPAWGFEGPAFLNCCVLYKIPADGHPVEQAQELLRTVKSIETSLGRRQEPLLNELGERVYHNRPIDIDILFFGKEVIQTEDLIIPHPLIAQRDFVLKPLKEIARASLREAFPEIFA